MWKSTVFEDFLLINRFYRLLLFVLISVRNNHFLTDTLYVYGMCTRVRVCYNHKQPSYYLQRDTSFLGLKQATPPHSLRRALSNIWPFPIEYCLPLCIHEKCWLQKIEYCMLWKHECLLMFNKSMKTAYIVSGEIICTHFTFHLSINSKTIVFTGLKFAHGKKYVIGNIKYNFQNIFFKEF